MTDDNSAESKKTAPGEASPETEAVPIEKLLASRREVVILHGDERYRLRITSNNKLILTK